MIEVLAIITLLQHPVALASHGGIVISGESGVVDPSRTPEEELDRLLDGGIKAYNYIVTVADDPASSVFGDSRLERNGELKLTIEASRPETTYLKVATKSAGTSISLSLLAQKKSAKKVLARRTIKLSLQDSSPVVIDRLFAQLKRFGRKADSQVAVTEEDLHEGLVPSFEDMAELAVLIALRAHQPDLGKDRRVTDNYRQVISRIFQRIEEL